MIFCLVAAAAIANVVLVVGLAEMMPETGEAGSGGLDATESGAAFAARLSA